jgi:hypothetical protein
MKIPRKRTNRGGGIERGRRQVQPSPTHYSSYRASDREHVKDPFHEVGHGYFSRIMGLWKVIMIYNLIL